MAPVNGLLDRVACSGDAAQVLTPLFPFQSFLMILQIFAIAGSGTPTSVPPTASTLPAVSAAAPSSSTLPPTVIQPVPVVKTGVKLDPAAVAEAHQRDNTATRAVTGAPIKVLFVKSAIPKALNFL